MGKDVRKIKLTNAEYVLVDDADYEWLNQYRWSWHMNGVQFRRIIDGKEVRTFMTHLILPRKTGYVIDHRDGDKLNNQKDNLRYATLSGNARNSGIRKDNTSGYKGICKRRNRWQAYIYHNCKQLHLGSFVTKEEAAKAYDNAARDLYGDFARLNGVGA